MVEEDWKVEVRVWRGGAPPLLWLVLWFGHTAFVIFWGSFLLEREHAFDGEGRRGFKIR